jgi:anti-anti-sigma regulatory factor
VLKITQQNLPAGVVIVALEGKLLEPWVDEVRGLFSATATTGRPRLDLSALTFVDTAGCDLLQQLLREGVVMESCSAFVAALLRLNDVEGSRQVRHAR